MLMCKVIYCFIRNLYSGEQFLTAKYITYQIKTNSRSELKINWKKLVQGQVIYHLNQQSELYKNIP